MIGIGVTVYNRHHIAIETIAKIKALTRSKFKLVVVDDGSKEPFEGATFRFGNNQGSPIAKNKCLELLEGCEHIFLIDDDTFPIKEGWEKAYIDAGIPHLNYTFKYPYDDIEGFRHLQNPNGCMMYIHRSVLDKVGGFDTGFIKYGYWHGAFSNRVYNSGLIPHPFIDLHDSSEFIYCMDQDRRHLTSRTDRGKYLAINKKRYHEKIDSSEYIDYKGRKPKVWYSNPFSIEKNIGKALNEFCELVPEGDWICLQDGDILYLTPEWGKQIHDVIETHGKDFGLIGCMTNRLGRSTQRLSLAIDNDHDMMNHYNTAIELRDKHYGEVEDITDKKFVAGMFMLFPKEVWNKVKFDEDTISFDDEFSKKVVSKGYKLGLMKGLYVYHLYRIWSNNPKLAKAHLNV